MANIQSRNKCPACRTVGEMLFDESKRTYTCQACGQEFSSTMIEGANTAASADVIAAQVKDAIHNIDSANTALVYVDTYFQGYNWRSYDLTSDIYLEDILIMVEKIKIKNADNAKTWMLEIGSIVVPLQHKMAALTKLQEQIAEKYKGDITTVASDLAIYNGCAQALLNAREELAPKLNCAIENMSKFGATAEEVKLYKKQVDDLFLGINQLVVSGDVEDLPVVKARMAANEKAIIAEYASRGINAVENYENGMAAYEAKRYADAVGYLEAIRDFRDSAKYIRMMNKVFVVKYLVEAGGKKFLTTEPGEVKGCKKAIAKIKAVKDKIVGFFKKNGKDLGVELFDMHELASITHHEKKACVKNASVILAAFGEYLYYIKGEKEVCVFNTRSQTSTTLHKAKDSLFLDTSIDNNGDAYASIKSGKNSVGDKLFIIETYDITRAKGCLPNKKGCMSKKKYKKFLSERQNIFSMIVVNLRTATLDTGIKEMMQCLEPEHNVADSLIYTVHEEIGKDKKGKPVYGRHTKTFDVNTGESTLLFDKPCYFHNIYGSYLVYETWEYHMNNATYWTYNLETGKHVRLERNAYKYFGVYENRFFYTVGNSQFSALFSINLDGTDKVEIMPNFKQGEIRSNAGWIYLLTKAPDKIGKLSANSTNDERQEARESRNARVLTRISPDGKEKFIVATDVYALNLISGNYAYYFSAYSSEKNNSEKGRNDKDFRIARLDGKTNMLVAPDVNMYGVSVGTNYVYYSRLEYMGLESASAFRSGSKYVKSLYRVDLDGHNVKKMLYNIELSVDKDVHIDNTDIYSVKQEVRNYRISTDKEEWEEEHEIECYYALNKATGVETPVLTLGVPTPENYKDLVKKGGCSLFKKKAEVKVEEIEVDIYGQLVEETLDDDDTINSSNDSAATAAAKKALDGCKTGCKKGCSFIRKK